MYADTVREWGEHKNGRLMRALVRAESMYGATLVKAAVVSVLIASVALLVVAF
jgi:hypothetical protein